MQKKNMQRNKDEINKNHLTKHVWRVGYQLGDKPGEHKYFDAGLPINAVFSECEIAIKKNEKPIFALSNYHLNKLVSEFW